MFLGIGTILCAVVFANQHLPCWLDEICMLDPAYHRTTEGVWRSIASWDSIDVIPFAPNYPLFINILRVFVAALGVNFWLLRGAMLFFGLVPLVALLWLFRHKSILQSRAEIIQAAYFSACFSFFWWAIYIRPEAILLSIVTLMVFAWSFDRPFLLFFFSLLVPVYGLQWNVLLLPVVLHWLVFGGRFRNLLLIGCAFTLSTLATIAVYHALDMWPSYLQQVANYHALDMDSASLQDSALANNNLWTHLHQACFSVYTLDFARWFGRHRIAPPLAFGLVFIVLGGFFGVLRSQKHHAARWWLFLSISVMGLLFVLGLFVNLGHYYVRLALAGISLFAPVFFRPVWRRWPILLLLMALVPLFPSTLVLWHATRDSTYALTGQGIPRSTRWMDETGLEQALAEVLTPKDTVCCADSAYFAIRSHCGNLMPLCYAFDLSSEQVRACTALLVEGTPVPALDYDYANWRKSSYTATMTQFFCPDKSCGDLWSFRVSPDELVAAISARWDCTFTEISLDFSSLPPNRIHYRLFRPVFPKKSGDPSSVLSLTTSIDVHE